MSNFDPKKLTVTIHPPVTTVAPVIGRKYTLTHSDETGMLFLDIGPMFNYLAIDPKMRDEVLAEWQLNTMGQLSLVGYAYVDSGEFSMNEASYRFQIFNKEMSTALKGIINGDRVLFSYHKTLLDAPIYIFFQSAYDEFRGRVYLGTPRQYLY